MTDQLIRENARPESNNQLRSSTSIFDGLPSEMLTKILQNIDAGSTYKCAYLVSREWRMILSSTNLRNDLCNHLLTLFRKFPRAEWDTFEVSRNPNITLSDCLKYPLLPWNINGLSCNPNITWEMMIVHPEFDWNLNHVSTNINLTVDILKNNIKGMNTPLGGIDGMFHTKPWHAGIVITHKCITKDDLGPELFEGPSYETFDLLNPNAEPLDLIIRAAKITNDDRHWLKRTIKVSHNLKIELSDISSNLNISWDWEDISSSRLVTINVLKETVNDKRCNWAWHLVSINFNITHQMILDNPTLPWNIQHLPKNPNIGWDIALSTLGEIGSEKYKGSIRRYVCGNKNITWERVINLLGDEKYSFGSKYCWKALSSNAFRKTKQR